MKDSLKITIHFLKVTSFKYWLYVLLDFRNLTCCFLPFQIDLGISTLINLINNNKLLVYRDMLENITLSSGFTMVWLKD